MSFKRVALTIARFLGLFRLARLATSRCVRILAYHGTWRAGLDYRGDAMFIRPETFAARMALLRRLGYPVVDIDDIADPERTLPPAAVVVTIDDGWHGVHADMLPLLRQYRIPATLYSDTANLQRAELIGHVMAHWLARIVPRSRWSPAAAASFGRATDPTVAPLERNEAARAFGAALGLDIAAIEASRTFHYMTPDELRDFAATPGLRVELHTHDHNLGDHAPDRVRLEVEQNRAALAAILGRPPETFRHFCYPSGLMAPGDPEILQSLGIRTATMTRRALATPGTSRLDLPRLLDGDQLSALEFEAELSGFLFLAREAGAVVRRIWRPASAPTAGGTATPVAHTYRPSVTVSQQTAA